MWADEPTEPLEAGPDVAVPWMSALRLVRWVADLLDADRGGRRVPNTPPPKIPQMLSAIRVLLVATATTLVLFGSAPPASAFGVVPPGTGDQPCDPSQMPCTGGGSAAAAAALLTTGVVLRRRR